MRFSSAIRTVWAVKVVLISVCIDLAHGAPQPANISLVGRTGDDVNEYLADFLLPVSQGRDSLLFIDARGAWLQHESDGEDLEEDELNLGVGWRLLVQDSDMIVGANAFYDMRSTVFDTDFDQVGAGIELLGERVDFRANYYYPLDDVRSSVTDTDTSTTKSSSSSLGPIFEQNGRRYRVRTTRTKTTATETTFERFEEPLPGYDVEIGVAVPFVSDYIDTRILGGYYHFRSDIGTDIEGPKARLELRPVPAIKLDLEVYDDDELNGTEYFVGLWLSLPLSIKSVMDGKNPCARFTDNLRFRNRNLRERLIEPVNRDFRIRVKEGETSNTQTTTTTKTKEETLDLGPVQKQEPDRINGEYHDGQATISRTDQELHAAAPTGFSS